MTTFRTYRRSDLAALVEAWNCSWEHCSFSAGTDFVPLTESDLLGRALDQPCFDPEGLLVAAQGDRISGFIHFGPVTNFWYQLSERRVVHDQGQIHAIVVPPSEPGLARDLLAAAADHLARRGARRLLLWPSWVQCTQPFYNGIAGAYEDPGLSCERPDLLAAAADQGFQPLARYATPELPLSPDRVSSLRREAQRLWDPLSGFALSVDTREVSSPFFPPRRMVRLACGLEVVATTAYGLWEEYTRAHGRRVYGITGVHVAPTWRGLGLGKLIVILALDAALAEGAEALHLHVYQDNKPAWNLYHRALGFQPRHEWATLLRKL